MTKPRLSLIIPALREAQIIQANLQKIADFLQANGLHETTEVIVVAATAGDNTAELAGGLKDQFRHFQLITPPQKVGKGRDVRLGFQAASGEYQIFMDADLATPLPHVLELLSLLEQGNDMAIGIRPLAKIHHGLRAFISRFGNLLTRIVLGTAVTDTQCGFKGFRRDMAQAVCTRQTVLGWGFDMELILIARLHGARIAQLKLSDWHDPRQTDQFTHEKRVGMGAAISTFRELLMIKWRAWQGKYR